MTPTEKHRLRELHRPGWAGAWLTLAYLTTFLAAAGLTAYLVSERQYLLAVPAVLANAYAMHFFLIAFHEAAHGGLCPWRPMNEYLGRAIGLFGFMSLTLYRAVHHWHHAYLGTARDEEFWPFTNPAAPQWKRRLAAAGELGFGLAYTPFLFARAFLRPGSRVGGQRGLMWAELLFPVAVWGAVFAEAVWFDAVEYFLACYLIPAFLAGNLQSLRKYVEHIGLTGNSWATLTRAVRDDGPFGRVLSASLLHEPFHDLHHRYPKVPQEELPKAAAVDPPLPGTTPVFPGYRAAFADMLRTIGDPKFGPAWRPMSEGPPRARRGAIKEDRREITLTSPR
jgi:fatty acid desaturase